MDTGDKLLAIFIGATATVALAITSACVINSVEESLLTEQAIKGGADPIAAACAIANTPAPPACIVKANGAR